MHTLSFPLSLSLSLSLYVCVCVFGLKIILLCIYMSTIKYTYYEYTDQMTHAHTYSLHNDVLLHNYCIQTLNNKINEVRGREK